MTIVSSYSIDERGNVHGWVKDHAGIEKHLNAAWLIFVQLVELYTSSCHFNHWVWELQGKEDTYLSKDHVSVSPRKSDDIELDKELKNQQKEEHSSVVEVVIQQLQAH